MMGLERMVPRRAKTQFGLDREGLVFASAYTFAKVMADNPNSHVVLRSGS